jgi:hypothetical protein
MIFYTACLYDNTGVFRVLYILAPDHVEANYKAQKMLYNLFGVYSTGVIEISPTMPIDIERLGNI